MHIIRTATFPAVRRAQCLAALILLLSIPAHSQLRFLQGGRPLIEDIGMGLLAPSPTRTIIPLNGEWKYNVSGAPDWHTVAVPVSYSGPENVTFTRSFDVDAQIARTAVFQLVALCISYYCEIHINDQFIGKHAGETSFSFKLSPGVIRPGRNTVTISVHNRLNARETLPLAEQLWDRKHYGGILHDIAIVARNSVWVQETNVRLQSSGEGKPGTIQYRAYLNSGLLGGKIGDSSSTGRFGKASVDHLVEVFDAQSGELVMRSEAKRVEMESDRLVPVNMTLVLPSVRMWSPETPNLYNIVQRTSRGGVQLDESYLQIGFRQFRADNGGFTLNGQPIFLKGVTYLETSPIRGRSMSADDLERDILIMKNLGANAVRLLYGAVHPMFLAICDRYGMLVFQDIPAIGVPSSILGSTAFQATAKNTLREMMMRDAHRASVVAVGLGYALDGAAEGYEQYFAALAPYLRENHEQLVYASFLRSPGNGLPEGLHFASFDLPPSMAARVRSAMDRILEQASDFPPLLSSVSYPVEVGNYNGYSDPRSIDAQAQFYLEVYNDAVARKMGGIFVHSFSDWEVSFPIMAVDRVQQFMATAGILDAHRQKRIAYEVLKARFNNEKPPVLVMGNFGPDHPAAFVVVGIFLILVFALMYNLFRRFRENVVRAFLRPYNFFSDVRDKRMLSIFQTSTVGLLGAMSLALLAGNIMYFWRTDHTVEFLTHQLFRSVWFKQWLNYAAWAPLANMAAIAAVVFIFLFILAVLLRFAAFFLRKRILMFDAYSVAMWCILPIVFLSPLGLVLYRIMALPVLEAAAVLTIVVFLFWVFSRLLKGASIVLDSRPLFFYVAGYGLLAAGIAAWLLWLDSSFETFAYLRYLLDKWLYMQSLAA